MAVRRPPRRDRPVPEPGPAGGRAVRGSSPARTVPWRRFHVPVRRVRRGRGMERAVELGPALETKQGRADRIEVPVLPPSPAGRSPSAVTRSKRSAARPGTTAGRSTSSARPIPITLEQTPANRPRQRTACATGFTYLRRRNVGLVSAGLVTYGAVRASEKCLGSVAALAQGDRGEQRGACEQRCRQIQRIVQRAGEGRVPCLDDLVQWRASG